MCRNGKWYAVPLQGICGTAVVLAVLLGAMNVTDIDKRSGSSDSYSHLLAKEYDKVAAIFEDKNFHSQAYYFYEKAYDVRDSYNPRPMTVGNIGHSDSHRKELRHMRRDLERAMVGYEMRHAPEYVAAMHAAFECRLQSVSLNSEMEKFCSRNFNSFKETAESTIQKSEMMIASFTEEIPQIVSMAPIPNDGEEIIAIEESTVQVDMSPIAPQKPDISEMLIATFEEEESKETRLSEMLTEAIEEGAEQKGRARFLKWLL